MSLNVLHVLPSLDEDHGGPLRLVLDLSALAEEKGLHSEVAGVGPLRVHDNPLLPGRIHAFSQGPTGAWRHSRSLRRWIRANLHRFQGVVIHGAWLYPGWAAARECQGAGVPYAYYPHGMLDRWAVDGQGALKAWKKRLYWRLWERAVANQACTTLFTTQREWDLTQQTLPVDSPKRLLVPYGIHPAVPRNIAPQTPTLTQPEDVRVALFLGRLHPKKNPELLIEAWRRARVPGHWRLVLAGSGPEPYVTRLKQAVAAAGLNATIQFTGFVSGLDKQYLLQRADWFLLPSSQENFGIAVLEAMQNGCAVAISDQVYLAESFPPDSEILPVTMEAWTEFFKQRLTDDVRRLSVRASVDKYVTPKFDMQYVVSQWRQTFHELFSKA